MKRHRLWCTGLIATAFLAWALDARAQTVAAPGVQSAVIRRVPAVSLSFGGGAADASDAGSGAALSVRIGARIHRHFALEGEVGHFEGAHLEEYPGGSYTAANGALVTYGPSGRRKTWDVWYGAVSLVGRLQTGRVLSWGGVGFAVGTDRGSISETFSSCSAPQAPELCSYAVNATYPNSFPIGMRLTAGLDVEVGHGAGVFASAGTVGRSGVFQAGVRVAVRSTDEVAPARLPAPATGAATTTPAWAADLRLARGDALWVTSVDGMERKGQLLALSDPDISLLVMGQPQTVPLSRVRLIEKPDSLRNGIRNGAIGGGAAMLAVAALGGLFGGADESSDVAAGLGAAAMGVGVGALVGAAIDARIQGRQVVYRAPAGSSVSVAPVLARRGAGIALRVRW